MLRFDTLQDYITCAIFTHTRFACKMHETHDKTCKKIRAEPHILFHFASRAGERANRWAVQTESIFLLPCGRGCVTGDLVLQSFGGRSLFSWMRNIWSIWGPCPCSVLKEWPVHLDLSQHTRVLRSCLLTARQTGSNAAALDLII